MSQLCPPYHHRWTCPKKTNVTDSPETCAYCICYICNIGFGPPFGCCKLSHKWAHPPDFDIWQADRSNSVKDLPNLVIPADKFECVSIFHIHVPAPGLKCPGVPENTLRTYLQTECDGSIIHDLACDFVTRDRESHQAINLLLHICPPERVTRTMIGNMQKPSGALTAAEALFGTVCVHDYTPSGACTLVVRIYAPCFRMKPYASVGIPIVNRMQRRASPVALSVAAVPAGMSDIIQQGSLFDFQVQTLQKMYDREITGLYSLLWTPLIDTVPDIHVSRVGGYVIRQPTRPNINVTGGFLEMPTCGKIRIVAALLNLNLQWRTLIVVPDDNVIARWESELDLFSPWKSRVQIVTVDTFRSMCRAADGVLYFDRVVLDRCSQIQNIVHARIVWGIASSSPSDLRRIRANSAVVAMLDIQSIFHYSHVSTLTLAEPVPSSIMPSANHSQQNIQLPPEWLAAYNYCLKVLEDNTHVLPDNVYRMQMKTLYGASMGNKSFMLDPLLLESQITAPHRPLLCETPDHDRICGICLEKLSCPLETPCGHFFCQKCIYTWIQAQGHDNTQCPNCRQAFTTDNLASRSTLTQYLPTLLPANQAKPAQIVQRCNRFLRIPNAYRIIIVSHFRHLRQVLMDDLIQSGIAATSDQKIFVSNLTWRVLVTCPASMQRHRMMGQANVVMFAEPVSKAFAKLIAQRVGKMGPQKESVESIVFCASELGEDRFIEQSTFEWK